jgi:hypothetical protein
MDNVEEAFEGFKEASYGDVKLPEGQHKDLRSAFFGGVAWFRSAMLEKVDDEEKGMEFLGEVNRELTVFVDGIKKGIN